MSEIRYAFRTLIKAPGPTLVMMLTLGVAVGAATVIYSVIDVVWHFVPARNQTRLVYAASTDTRVVQAEGGSAQRGACARPSSVPDLADWTRAVDDVRAARRIQHGLGQPHRRRVPLRLTAIRVTANLPDVWGLTPALGRAFRRDEGRAGSAAGHDALARILAAALLGKPRRPRTDDAARRGAAHDRRRAPPRRWRRVLSRAPTSSRRSRSTRCATPRDRRDVLVTGRLKTGVTREQADAELQTIARQLGREHPATNERIGAAVLPLIEASGFNVRILLTILGLIGLLIVVVACANVASVTVAQSLARRHELAVHAALGATRGDRIRRLLIESVIVSAAAGVVGLLVAALGIGWPAMAGQHDIRLRRHADEWTRARCAVCSSRVRRRSASACSRRYAWRRRIRRNCATAPARPVPRAAADACAT